MSGSHTYVLELRLLYENDSHMVPLLGGQALC